MLNRLKPEPPPVLVTAFGALVTVTGPMLGLSVRAFMGR